MKKFIIDNFAAFMMSSRLWTRVKHIVATLESESLTGAEKRARALDDLEVIGIDTAKFLVNLAIELAVAYLRLK
jgi:hypothetical protein